MNFSHESLNARQQSENFCYDVAMPRGHFFAVLDFGAHDYTNLNSALRGKLETIVGSFSSLPDFSDDLFLGFLAKEINNFVHNLSQQSGDPELPFGAALVLLSGKRFSFFLAGDVAIRIPSGESLLPSEQATGLQLGTRMLETPLTDLVQNLTLQNSDTVLIMTQSVAETLGTLSNVGGSDAKSICESLMKAGESSPKGRTLIVICGPYQELERAAEPDADALSELRTSIASLEARLDSLTQTNATAPAPNESELDKKFQQRVESLTAEMRGKAPRIDVLEVQEKLKGLETLLAGKADSTSVLGLQRDVLKLGIASAPSSSLETGQVSSSSTAPEQITTNDVAEKIPTPAARFPFAAAILIVALSLAAGFGGGWLHSRLSKKPAELWSVRTSGNQVVITRLDYSNSEGVMMTLAQPLNSDGEQKFSSFADVKKYVDTIASQPAVPSQPNQTAALPDNKTLESTSAIIIKSGDSLRKLAQTYNVTPEKIMELNPTIKKWQTVPIGQKVFVPSVVSTATPSPAPAVSPSGQLASSTAEVTVGPGDSLNQLARRFNTTAAKLRELNPSFNWPRIQAGQKVIVPAPSGG